MSSKEDTSTPTDRRTSEEASRPKMVHWTFPTVKRTPGFFHVSQDFAHKTHIVSEGGHAIANCTLSGLTHADPKQNIPEAEANARLLAASPALLADLHAIDRAYDASQQHGHSIAHNLGQAILQARATLSIAGLSVLECESPEAQTQPSPTAPERMGDLAPELLAALKDLIGCADQQRDRAELKAARALVRRAEASTITTEPGPKAETTNYVAAQLMRGCNAAAAYLIEPPSVYPENRAAAAEIIMDALSKAKAAGIKPENLAQQSHVADALFRTCDDLARIARQENLPKPIQDQMIEAAEIGYSSLDKIGYFARNTGTAATKPTRIAPLLPEGGPSKKTR
jgi:hypothetical protein